MVDAEVPINACRTFSLARGVADLPLIPGVSIGTLQEFSDSTINADKVITF